MQDGADVGFGESHEPRDRAARPSRPVLERHQLALAIRQRREEPREPRRVRSGLRHLLWGRTLRNVERLLERRVAAELPAAIDGDPTGDRHQPRAEAGEVTPIAVPRTPRLLEGERGQVLGLGTLADPVAEEIVDAWQ